jgi:quinol monooxygenase YgiN
MLEPTKEVVKDVMDNKIIKEGLEDPEVLFAVQEIAANPDAIQKHRHNPKVAAFYSHLGKLMGSKLGLQENKGKQ